MRGTAVFWPCGAYNAAAGCQSWRETQAVFVPSSSRSPDLPSSLKSLSSIYGLPQAVMDSVPLVGLHFWRNVRQRSLTKAPMNERLVFVPGLLNPANHIQLEEK